MRGCPKCKQGLATRDLWADEQKVQIDVCVGCGGVWLDGGEIVHMKQLHGLVPHLYGNVSVKRDLNGGPCPSCETRPLLQRVPVGAFAVDRCLSCLGLWFDGGELGSMLTRQGYDALLLALAKALPH